MAPCSTGSAEAVRQLTMSASRTAASGSGERLCVDSLRRQLRGEPRRRFRRFGSRSEPVAARAGRRGESGHGSSPGRRRRARRASRRRSRASKSAPSAESAAVFMRVKLSPWIAASGRPRAASNNVTTDWILGTSPERLLPGKTVAVLTATPRAGCQASQVSAELAVPGASIDSRSTSPISAFAMRRAQRLDERQRLERCSPRHPRRSGACRPRVQMSFIRRIAS